jgi:hypothetical protein
MSDAPVTTETATTQTTETTETTQAPVGSALDFIPESYRAASWATKYTSADDFFKGIDNLSKLAGQKQVVQGLQAPGESATEEEWSKFFGQIGRPEAADKYALPEDVSAPQGVNLEEERKTFTALAHKNGLTQRQAAGLFKDYMAGLSEQATKAQAGAKLSHEEALKGAFGDDAEAGLVQAKKGAQALGIGDKLDAAGLSTNPLVLQLCAKLGELAGEASFESGKATDNKETIMERAKKLQTSPAYWTDPKVFAEVEELYKRANGL